MHVDQSSLTELGLLPDAYGAWPLALWLDHTHSRPGHDALRQLIASPLNSIEGIAARQALLPLLPQVAKEVAWSDLLAHAVQAERFLSSNYVIVPSGRLKRTLFAARYRDIATYVLQQLRAVDALLTLCSDVYTRIATMNDDVGFATVVSAFEVAVQDPRRGLLRRAVVRGNESLILAFDSLVRATAARDAATRETTLDVAAAVDTASRHPDTDTVTVLVPSMRTALQALIAAIWQLDAFCSLAIASRAVGGVLPRITPRTGDALELHDIRHPLLPSGVTNDAQLALDERVFFLTGPNMAGKSTLLRAIGLAVHCAHLGMAVAARASCIPLYDRLLVSITARDNLQRGESLYLAEVRRVRAIVDAVDRGDAVLAIFDEVFRGTNIKDAAEATTLLVDGLARASLGTFIIASHLAEVAESRSSHAGVGCWRIEVDTTGGFPRFTHRLRRGVSDVHLGMVLLDAEGVGPVLRRMAAQ